MVLCADRVHEAALKACMDELQSNQLDGLNKSLAESNGAVQPLISKLKTAITGLEDCKKAVAKVFVVFDEVMRRLLQLGLTIATIDLYYNIQMHLRRKI